MLSGCRLGGALGLSLVLNGCGTNAGIAGLADGGGSSAPVSHVLLNDQPGFAPAGEACIVDFSLPSASFVEWSLAAGSTTAADSVYVALTDDSQLLLFQIGQA